VWQVDGELLGSDAEPPDFNDRANWGARPFDNWLATEDLVVRDYVTVRRRIHHILSTP
jgi:hypothetical protein